MIVVVDHQDSFVYNLVQFVGAAGHSVEVVSSTRTSAADLAELNPAAVILSPGPGSPQDAGCFVQVVQQLPVHIPLLGVCLGHQALGFAYGARVARAPHPVHGKVSLIEHDGSGLFCGLPSPLEVGRYHSLIVAADGLPDELLVCARTEDNLVMAVRHRDLPRFGLQFHPESILTPEGPRLLQAFLSSALPL